MPTVVGLGRAVGRRRYGGPVLSDCLYVYVFLCVCVCLLVCVRVCVFVCICNTMKMAFVGTTFLIIFRNNQMFVQFSINLFFS